MHASGLTLDQPQQQTLQLMRTYANALDQEGTFMSAESQFERACLTMSETGWRLKQASHRGSIVSPYAIVATYEKAQ